MKVFIQRIFSVWCLLSLFLTLSLTGSHVVAANDKPFFWRINSQEATVYLLGSLHAATVDMYPLPASLYQAFKESNYLVVELDINNIDAQEQLRAIQKYGLYSDGSQIDQHISNKTWQQLKGYLKSRQMSERQIRAMKPWLVNLTVTVSEFGRLGYDTALGIDQHFLDRAKGKPIIALETLEGQMKVLASASDEQQESNLVITLDSVDEMAETMNLMRTLWKQGDAEGLYDAMKIDSEKYPGFEKQWEALLDTRNIAMAEKIKSYMKSDATFFVIVGALHMGGENGLLNLLDKEGYRVRQVNH